MTPSDPEFWPPTMTRSGHTATRAQMAQAWQRFSLAGLRGVPALCKALFDEGVESTGWAWRLADAMLQRARKAGHIHYDGREWREGPGE